jgi:hypothetical protein
MWSNKLKRQLEEGKVAVGTWIGYSDVRYAANLGRVGFDWVGNGGRSSLCRLDRGPVRGDVL